MAHAAHSTLASLRARKLQAEKALSSAQLRNLRARVALLASTGAGAPAGRGGRRAAPGMGAVTRGRGLLSGVGSAGEALPQVVEGSPGLRRLAVESVEGSDGRGEGVEGGLRDASGAGDPREADQLDPLRLAEVADQQLELDRVVHALLHDGWWGASIRISSGLDLAGRARPPP